MILAIGISVLWFFSRDGYGAGSVMAVGPTDVPLAGAPAILLIVGILLLNGIFVGAEASLDALRPMHVRHVREKSAVGAERLQFLLDRRIPYVSASILGSHLCRVGMVLASLLLVGGVSQRLNLTFFGAAAVVAIPILLLNLVFELVPRSYGALHPHRLALAFYRFIQVSSTILMIPARLVTSLANLVTTRFGASATLGIANQAEEEIKTLVETAEESGEIESEERELLHSVFEFTDTVAREVMTPRVDLDAMPVKSDPAEVMKVIQESGHSRIPLYEDTDDQIVGIIHAKDLLMAATNGAAPVSLRKLMRPALFVPENKNLHELLREMRQAKTQMAIVQDEFGGTAGIVTIEDIVEELVGEIVDEYDDERPPIEEVPDGWLVDGKTHVDDVNAAVGAHFDSEEFDTIGGYVFGLFGRQPKLDETIVAEHFEFRVAETDGRRILRLKLRRVEIESDIEALSANG